LTYRGFNALAEAFNSLYKWELIYRQVPWKGLDEVEFATMGYVDWSGSSPPSR
jgi:putative transposase